MEVNAAKECRHRQAGCKNTGAAKHQINRELGRLSVDLRFQHYQISKVPQVLLRVPYSTKGNVVNSIKLTFTSHVCPLESRASIFSIHHALHE